MENTPQEVKHAMARVRREIAKSLIIPTAMLFATAGLLVYMSHQGFGPRLF